MAPTTVAPAAGSSERHDVSPVIRLGSQGISLALSAEQHADQPDYAYYDGTDHLEFPGGAVAWKPDVV